MLLGIDLHELATAAAKKAQKEKEEREKKAKQDKEEMQVWIWVWFGFNNQVCVVLSQKKEAELAKKKAAEEKPPGDRAPGREAAIEFAVTGDEAAKF